MDDSKKAGKEPKENEADKGSDTTGNNPGQEQPQTIQFQIPFQVPLQQPVLQAQQQQAIQQNAPVQLQNVVDLVNSVKEATKEGNASESQVPSQIILIASAILTIVGIFALTKDTKKISWQVGTLLLIAVLGLGTSLIAGVFHFASERKFWYRNREKGMFAINMLGTIRNGEDRDNAALMASNQMDQSSTRFAFWTQISSFTVGVVALIILIVAEIIAKVHGK